MKEQIKPGYFSQIADADSRRFEFDAHNEQVLAGEDHPDIVFIGDSITQMLEVNAQFHRSGLYIVNRGISGDEMRYIARRFAADVLQLEPTYCVLMAGINDSWNMDDTPELRRRGESLESTLERVKGYFNDVIAQARQSGVKLIIGAVMPVDTQWAGVDGIRNEYVRKINAFLEQRCREEKIPFVDYYSALVRNDGSGLVQAELTYEGVHPTAAGYSRMVEKLRSVMREIGVNL